MFRLYIIEAEYWLSEGMLTEHDHFSLVLDITDELHKHCSSVEPEQCLCLDLLLCSRTTSLCSRN